MIQVACTKARKFGQKNSVARWILFRSLGWLYKVGLHGMLGTGGVHNGTAQMRRLQCRQVGLGGSSASTMMLHYSWWVQTAPAARSLQRYAPSLPGSEDQSVQVSRRAAATVGCPDCTPGKLQHRAPYSCLNPLHKKRARRPTTLLEKEMPFAPCT